MAITIRCTGCKKKISMDEAFAGGACRCPYCREIVLVGGSAGPGVKKRPEAPSARPESPMDEAAPVAENAPVMADIVSHADVPMAKPVRLQGVVTIVLLGLLLAMVGGAIYLALQLSKTEVITGPDGTKTVVRPGESPRTPTTATVDKPPVNPFSTPSAASGAAVAGMKLTAPVVYCLDSGGSMKEVFNYAYEMTRVSVLVLKPSDKFTVMVSAQGEDKIIEGAGGKDGEEAIVGVADITPQGSADIKKTILTAIEKKPRTIVVFRRSAIPDADEIVERAKAENVTILTVGLTTSESAAAGMQKLSQATGGASAIFTESDLANWTQQTP